MIDTYMVYQCSICGGMVKTNTDDYTMMFTTKKTYTLCGLIECYRRAFDLVYNTKIARGEYNEH